MAPARWADPGLRRNICPKDTYIHIHMKPVECCERGEVVSVQNNKTRSKKGKVNHGACVTLIWGVTGNLRLAEPHVQTPRLQMKRSPGPWRGGAGGRRSPTPSNVDLKVCKTAVTGLKLIGTLAAQKLWRRRSLKSWRRGADGKGTGGSRTGAGPPRVRPPASSPTPDSGSDSSIPTPLSVEELGRLRRPLPQVVAGSQPEVRGEVGVVSAREGHALRAGAPQVVSREDVAGVLRPLRLWSSHLRASHPRGLPCGRKREEFRGALGAPSLGPKEKM